MNLARLDMLDEEVKRDLADESALSARTYYFHQNKWWVLEDKKEASANLASELIECLQANVPSRQRNSKFANFPLIDMQAVVRAEFEVALKADRRAAIQRVIVRSARNASNAYAVKYNQLTGLLAKKALNDEISFKLNSLVSAENEEMDSRAEGVVSPGLCVLALDIDHFKQVNDTFGHSYGDIVLKAFAVRVDRAAKIYADKIGNLHTICAHVSGEEFFCVAWGNVENSVFEDMAEYILRSVGGTPLPSTSELSLFSGTYDTSAVTMPDSRYRIITCSIGGVVTGSSRLMLTADKLLKQADLALYKSKAQGRNRVTFYSNILQSGGRVLEHDCDVGVSVIDIGEEVGVVKGQEFLVFHPKFIGSHPFIMDDGRSKKVLGNFPRAPLCRITVFDVQQQISFCRMSEEKFSVCKIPKDACLEAIPLGALATLMNDMTLNSHLGELSEAIFGVKDTQNRLSHNLGADSVTSYAIVRLRNEAQIMEAFGPSLVNRSLLTAFEQLKNLTHVIYIGQLEPTQLLLEYESFAKQNAIDLENALKQVEATCGNRIRFVGGVCSGSRINTDSFRLPKDEAVKPSIRVQIARYAASNEASDGENRVNVFTVNTAEKILLKLRELREPRRGLADYQVFTQFGIESATLENAAGLLAASMGDNARAEVHYKKAAAIKPGVLVFKLNTISAQVQQGNYRDGYKTYLTMDLNVLEDGYCKYPFGAASLARSLAVTALENNDVADLKVAKKWLIKALALEQSSVMKKKLDGLLERVELCI